MSSADPKELLKRYQPKQVKVIALDKQLGCARFGPCGKVLAAGTFQGTVRRWDSSADAFAELPPVGGLGGWVQALAFHPDAKRLFVGDSWGKLVCLPYADKEPKPIWTADAGSWVRKLAISPGGKALATCGTDRKVRLWSADDGKPLAVLDGHNEDVLAVAFHPDGQSIVSGDLKGVVKQWDAASGKAVRDLDAKVLFHRDRIQDVGGVRLLVFDKEGKALACGGAQPKTGGFVTAVPHLLLFDWASGKVEHTLKGANENEGYFFDAAFHPDGFVMAVTSGSPGQGKLLFQRPADAAPFFAAPMANCHALAVHPDGRRLAVVATNANSAGNGRPRGKGDEYPGNFSPIHIWDLPRGG